MFLKSQTFKTWKTIGRKISVKASATKLLNKPPPGDKTLGIDPEIRFYKLEDGGDTEEVEESEIIVIRDSSIAPSKQYLINRKFPYIDTFDHEGPAVVRSM